jgi:prepilin-type N-terminal cleavage/methylation domain-containing protein
MPIRLRAFSLLELMIVIVIIGVLSGILFVGFGAIRRSQDQRNTRAALEVARSLFNEYVNQARSGGNNVTSTTGGNSQFYLRLAPSQWDFNGATFNTTPNTVDIAALRAGGQTDLANSMDFYNVPARNGTTPTDIPLAMDVPTTEIASSKNVGGTDLENDWFPNKASNPAKYQQRWQVWSTMQTIRRLRSSPEAKNMWSTLRESQIVHVGAPDSRQDMIVDAWGHPLLFVPGTGVRGIQYGELAATNPKTSRTVPPSWVTVDPGTGPLDRQGLRSPDGRGFWFSAGPDGYYDTHDDNLYSFDN